MTVELEQTISPLVLRLLGCLESEAEAAGVPGFCRLGPMPYGSVIIDACGECYGGEDCGGQAWVRLVYSFASTDFPNEDAAAQCATGRAFALEVGIARCTPTMDDDGNPPSEDAVLAAWMLQMADMRVMQRAISCCFGADDVDLDYVLGQYLPNPDQGACGFSTWNVLVKP